MNGAGVAGMCGVLLDVVNVTKERFESLMEAARCADGSCTLNAGG